MLRTRILSALVMAPPALLAVWWGGYAFAALAALAAAIMCWEWERIVTGGRFTPIGRLCAVVCAGSALLAVTYPFYAVLIVATAALVSGGLGRSLWSLVGPLYAGLPSVALVWIRGEGAGGLETMLWLMLLVWATDIGAYAAGRLIGGPLLLPAVSPKKTWAGLMGGVISAALVGLGAGIVLDLAYPVAVAVGSGFLAVVAQAGDLAESWIKRRWGVKDSSNIIPGHGGVMDRVDGLLAVGVVLALASWASGTAVLYWQ